MTELFIDGTPVVLPKSFSIAVKRENPFFTKNGEYTYDISLPLDNPTNAKLYEHLNRLNSVTEVRTERSAVLRADNRVYCNGTEVITGWTEDTVNIQIASGNSELNYVIGGDKLVSELEMRDTPIESGTEHNYVEKVYPEVDFCLPSVSGDGDEVMNEWQLNTDNLAEISLEFVQNPMPQPYLLAYLKELLSALNYELDTSLYETDEFQYLFIVQGYGTKWNEMLPGWTVTEFLDEIEKLLNCTFVIDSKRHTATMVPNNRYFIGQKAVHMQQVSDVFELEIEDENEAVDYNGERVAYQKGSTDFWDVQCLPDSYLQQASIVTIPATYDPSRWEIDRADRFFLQYKGYVEGQIFYDELHKRYYFAHFDKDGNYNSDGRGDDGGVLVDPDSPRYRMGQFAVMDSFAPLNREYEDGTEFKIVPAEIGEVRVPVTTVIGGTGGTEDVPSFMAVGSFETEDESSEEENQNELDVIKNWSDDSESAGTVCLAFYKGLHEVTGVITSSAGTSQEYTYSVPWVAVDKIQLYSDLMNGHLYYNTGLQVSLRLSDLQTLCYEGVYDIDLKKAITMTCYDPNLYDPNLVFEIRNKRYVCREMEFTLDANGRKGPWTGIFYPIRISDTEADLRWILADGKWRDGGVWLDNGRWLDS